MHFEIHTGNQEWAGKTMPLASGMKIQVAADTAIGEDEWSLCRDGEPLAGPFPITDQTRREIDVLIKKHGKGSSLPASPAPVVTAPPRATPESQPELLTLENVTKNIISLQKKTIRNYIEIGRWLIEAKALIGHGNWLEYLQTVHLPEWQAQACIRMHHEWGANPRSIEDLNFTDVLLLLDAPPEARPELIEVARTQPTRVLRQRVRLLRRSVTPPVTPPDPIIVLDEPALSTPPIPDPPAVHAPATTPQSESAIPPAPPVLPDTPVPAPEIAAQEAEPPARQPGPPEQAPQPRKTQTPTLPPPPPDPALQRQAELRERAFAVNRTVSDIHDLITRSRSILDTANAQECGDAIDLGALYECTDLLTDVLQVMKQIAADCARN